MKQVAWLLPLCAVPFIWADEVLLTILIFAFIFGIFAIGFNIIFGFAGQLTMFHSAAFGIGAYATYLGLSVGGLSFRASLGFALIILVLVSLVIGWICFKFKLREFYFAIVTLAFAELVRLVAVNWTSVTNGTLGLLVLEKPKIALGVVDLTIDSTVPWYFFVLASFTAVALICAIIKRSFIGRNFAAIRLNEELAQTLGINTFRYKMLSFTLSNIFAGFAGALYGFYTGYIEPHYMSIIHSLDVIAMVLLGGVGTVMGPLVGAAILIGLPHVIELSAEVRVMTFGAILIMTILFMPKGIVGFLERKRNAA